jgi:hypothetical protein
LQFLGFLKENLVEISLRGLTSILGLLIFKLVENFKSDEGEISSPELAGKTYF